MSKTLSASGLPPPSASPVVPPKVGQADKQGGGEIAEISALNQLKQLIVWIKIIKIIQ